eukprot:758615-Hanusia_phi.AAC.2
MIFRKKPDYERAADCYQKAAQILRSPAVCPHISFACRFMSLRYERQPLRLLIKTIVTLLAQVKKFSDAVKAFENASNAHVKAGPVLYGCKQSFMLEQEHNFLEQ